MTGVQRPDQPGITQQAIARLRVVVAGAHGRTGALVVQQLVRSGHHVTGLVRRCDHVSRLQAHGAAGVELDLTRATPAELAQVLRGADAMVFAAGSTYDSTPQESVAINRDAAITCIDAAVDAGVRHVAMISAHRVDEDFGGASTLTYLRAKRAADAHLRAQTRLRWTIVRPDALTDDEPTGHVHIGERVPNGALPRADLAAVVIIALTSAGDNAQFEVIGGHTSIAQATLAPTRN